MEALVDRRSGIRSNTSGPLWLAFVSLTFLFLIWGYGKITHPHFISPLADNQTGIVYAAEHPTASPTPSILPLPTGFEIDVFVGSAVDEFFQEPGKQSETRMILHCLLNRESKHAHSIGHGDNGKAGGPLQFWQDTWNGYRKIMMKDDLAKEIGSRYDLKESIRTTVWAIKTGRATAWGPVLRESLGKKNQTCPVPSWY